MLFKQTGVVCHHIHKATSIHIRNKVFFYNNIVKSRPYVTYCTFAAWFTFAWNATQLTVCPVKTAVRPACLRDLMDFIWDIRLRSLSGGFRWLNEVTTENITR